MFARHISSYRLTLVDLAVGQWPKTRFGLLLEDVNVGDGRRIGFGVWIRRRVCEDGL